MYTQAGRSAENSGRIRRFANAGSHSQVPLVLWVLLVPLAVYVTRCNFVFAAETQPALLPTTIAATQPTTAPAPGSETLANDDPAGFEARKALTVGWHRSEYRVFKFPKMGLPADLAKLYLSSGTDAASLLAASQAMDWTSAFDRGPKGVQYGEIFTYPPLARLLYMYGDKMPRDQFAHLKQQLLTRAYDLLEHGTENHAIMRVASGYLICQYFSGETWHNTDGIMRTSEEMMAAQKKLLLQRGRGFFAKSNNEVLSSTYIVPNVNPLLNLIDFAKDPEVKKIGEALALYHMSELALNDFKGHVIPPFNRQNSQQEQFDRPPGVKGTHDLSLAGQLMWLYWGQNRPYADDFKLAGEPSFNVLFALSNWRLPDAINRIAAGEGTPYAIRSSIPAFGLWATGAPDETLRSVWRDKDFAIGAMPLQRMTPGDFFMDYSLFGICWTSTHRFNYLEAFQPYWRSNSGEDLWQHGAASPFEQMAHYKNTAIMLFDIPEKDPWAQRGQARFTTLRDKHYDHLLQVAECRFPKTVDQQVIDGDWYFLREGDVYIGIHVLQPGSVLKTDLKGNGIDDFNVIKSYAAKTGFIFEVGTAQTRGSFDDFCRKLKTNPLTIGWDTLEASYTNTDGDRLWIKYNPDLTENSEHIVKLAPQVKINDVPLDLDHWPTTQSPEVNLEDSVLTVGNGPDQVRVDWRGELPVISGVQE